jgi:transposase
MYALVYDENGRPQPLKKVISVHKTRRAAEKALDKRIHKLGKRVWESNTHIVWIDLEVKAGDFVSARHFFTWRPGKIVPEGERYSDTD